MMNRWGSFLFWGRCSSRLLYLGGGSLDLLQDFNRLLACLGRRADIGFTLSYGCINGFYFWLTPGYFLFGNRNTGGEYFFSFFWLPNLWLGGFFYAKKSVGFLSRSSRPISPSWYARVVALISSLNAPPDICDRSPICFSTPSKPSVS